MAISMLLVLMLVPAALLTGCSDSVAESQVAARVGNELLTQTQVSLQIPVGLKGEDSLRMARQLIDEWVNEQLLYQQGMATLPDVKQLEEQATEYRRNLIAQSYEKEMLERYAREVPDSACHRFYEQYAQQFKLKEPVVKGFFMMVPLSASAAQLREPKNWMKELLSENTDHVEQLEQFCQQKAAYYDAFLSSWVDLQRLTNRLPVKVVEPASFLKLQVYELKDDDWIYLFVINDYRLPGEVQPFDYALSDIRDILAQQERASFRRQLLHDLLEQGLASGRVVKKF